MSCRTFNAGRLWFPSYPMRAQTVDVSPLPMALAFSTRGALVAADRLLRRAFIGLSLGLLLGTAAHARSAEAPQNGGTIVTVPGVGLGPTAAINGLNPLLTSSAYDAQAEGMLYQPLLWIDRTLHIDYSRSIARSIDVSGDGTVFTIELHHHWHWSDGKPVTSADVAYTYHMILKLGEAYPDYDGGGVPTAVKSFDVLGPYRIRVTTTHPVNARWFEFNGLGKLIPLPEHAWQQHSVHDLTDHLEDPAYFQVVDGPFRLDRFKLGRYISFVPNTTYSGWDKPHIARLVFKFMNSSEAIFFALKSGELQLATLPWGMYPARKQLQGYKETFVGPGWGYGYLGFNYHAPAISFIRDVRVRQAIMHAIDQDQIIRVEYFGHGVRDYGPIPPRGVSFLSPLANHLIQHGAYDPALADRLLDAAGWRMGPDHIRYKDGRPLKITMMMQADRVTEPSMLKNMLAKVGIDLELRTMPFNEVIAKIMDPKDTEWQAIYLSWSLSAYPSQESLYGCSSTYNSYHYCDRHLDALANAVKSPGGDAALMQFEDYFIEQQPVVILPSYKIVVESASAIHGLDKAISPLGSFSPQYLWIDHGAAGQGTAG